MYVGLVDPLTEAAKIRVTYNGNEILLRDFAAGETPELRFETPRESGKAEAFLIQGDKTTPMGRAEYIYDDLLGAKMLMERATALRKENKSWAARTKLLHAISLLERLSPDSEDMAQAYLAMSFAYFFSKSRKNKVAQRRKEALGWYEKALAVWERNGDVESLRGNLSNVSVMYSRIGDGKTALARAERALKLQRAATTTNEESVGAWTHAAGRNLEAGNLGRAERIIKDGLKRLGKDTPNCGYLWDLWARVLEERARRFREKAESILKEGLPAEHCSLG